LTGDRRELFDSISSRAHQRAGIVRLACRRRREGPPFHIERALVLLS
jgi:hypothetical protein